MAGSILFFLIGLHDDKFKSPPLLRLFLQFIVAFFVSVNGFYLPPISLNFPLFGEVTLQLPLLINQILTIIWIVGITNSINWLDGIDGLASGYCSICVFGLLFATILQNNYLGIIFFSILLGSTLGFLIRNFKPAYYIMGDCGSNFLGFILSTSSIRFLQQSNDSSISIYYLIFLFSLPLGDMIFVIFNRF